MNGIHDLGGMHGFGAVPRDPAAFHADWERTILAIDRILKSEGVYNGDQKRYAIERMDPQRYLDGYFQRWVAAVERLLDESGRVDEARVAARAATLAAGEADATLAAGDDATGTPDGRIAGDALSRFRTPAAHDRPLDDQPRFDPGDRVVVRRRHPAGHTRCPRYVRGCEGVVRERHGGHVFPDARAHGSDETHALYGVRFDAAAVWGDETDGRAINLDLWEPYLVPARDNN